MPELNKDKAPERIYLHNPENVEQLPCACGKDICYVPESTHATVRREARAEALKEAVNIVRGFLAGGRGIAVQAVIEALERAAQSEEGGGNG